MLFRCSKTHPLPIIRCPSALISVDTFHWEVAEAAVLAGANYINDIYSFTGPDYPFIELHASLGHIPLSNTNSGVTVNP